jgi:hypothetical protein
MVDGLSFSWTLGAVFGRIRKEPHPALSFQWASLAGSDPGVLQVGSDGWSMASENG